MKFLLVFLITLSAWASPPDFRFDGGRNAVFVDFIKASYHLNIRSFGALTYVDSTIEFYQPRKGHALLVSRMGLGQLKIDGKRVESLPLTSPDKATEYIALADETNAGRHTITVRTALSTDFFGEPEVYFKMRDLYGQFLERFLPTNEEYDQYKMEMKVSLYTSEAAAFEVQSNGDIQRVSDSQWTLNFPAYFNTSSIFFHLYKRDKYQHKTSAFVTESGRLLPIILYGDKTQNLAEYDAQALLVLKELENDYGEFAHPKLVIYAQGKSGGMEYAGATETSMVSLDHELFHSYFGRGVQPANGNTGALDEGLASWRDYGYFNVQEPNYRHGHIAGHSVYTRNTDKKSYKQGRSFFAYLDQKLKDQGGLKPFLKYFFQKYKLQVYKLETFQQELNSFTGKNFDADFERYLI